MGVADKQNEETCREILDVLFAVNVSREILIYDSTFSISIRMLLCLSALSVDQKELRQSDETVHYAIKHSPVDKVYINTVDTITIRRRFRRQAKNFISSHCRVNYMQ